VLDADAAEERGKGEPVILVRWETSPDDFPGMKQSAGVLTAHGGLTSHAAVVARGMGKPCVAGCEDLDIDTGARTVRIGSHHLREGDVITIDGGTGRVIIGEVRLVPPAINKANVRKYVKNSTALTDYREFPKRTHHTVGQTGWEEVADHAIQWANMNARGQVTLDDVKAAFAPDRTYTTPGSPEIRA